MPSLNENKTGQGYWRSLNEKANTPEFQETLAREFSDYNPDDITAPSRRSFLKVMGASMALAGLTLAGCKRWPKRRLAPFSTRPEGRIPGKPEQYATVMPFAGYALPLLVTSYDGRPVKIEGNPIHPDSKGATNTYAQASILELYDPERARGITKNDGTSLTSSDWADFIAFAQPHFHEKSEKLGAGVAVLACFDGSPTMEGLRSEFLKKYPKASWTAYESVNHSNRNTGIKALLGKAYQPRFNLSKAKTIVCFDEDLLMDPLEGTRLTREFADGRRRIDDYVLKGDKSAKPNRLYVAEPALTPTGTMADNRIATNASNIKQLVINLIAALNGEKLPEDHFSDWVKAVARDLKDNNGESLVVAGERQPAEVHQLVAYINHQLGNDGSTIQYMERPNWSPENPNADIVKLVEAINAGQIDTLIMLGGNPVYDAPADLNFAQALAKVDQTIKLGLYEDETAQLCDWHINQAHYLTAWGDAISSSGDYSVVQPTILPLFKGLSSIELVNWLTLAGDYEPGENAKDIKLTPGYDLLRESFKKRSLANTVETEKQWRITLHDGKAKSGKNANREVVPVAGSVASLLGPAKAIKNGVVELSLAPCASVYDGRFANNGWLQELPDSISKVVWDNALQMAPADASDRGFETGDLVNVTVNGQKLIVVVNKMVGIAPGSMTLTLGYGRLEGGSLSKGVGFNAYKLYNAKQGLIINDFKVTASGQKYNLTMTQDHHLIDKVGMYGREKKVGPQYGSADLYRQASVKGYKENKYFAHGHDSTHWGNRIALPQLYGSPVHYEEDENVDYMWGMTIDLNTCTGCNACVVACQAENNVPIVGKEMVEAGREMQWLRLDRYFRGDANDPNIEAVHEPVACMHCENAPCEQVCPVNATVHDQDGLNVMVYNRCVGTRYCSNNCPYKVRRFNYFNWHVRNPRHEGSTAPFIGLPEMESQLTNKIARMQFNPEVTVRMRGVMEKCTYCVQRIRTAKVDAINEERVVEPGEVLTACQQTCAAGAIQFGNLKPGSGDDQLIKDYKDNPRSFGMLTDLNTRPRTKYLARIRNPAEGTDTYEGMSKSTGHH